MRYRNRIKLAPGLNINLSRSGISATVGPRGANINIGKSGSYLNTGIPGTGLYKRNRISGLNGRPEHLTSNSTNNVGVQLDLNENYEPVIQIFSESGSNITSETLINKIKRTSEYKENLKTIYKKYEDLIHKQTLEFTEIHKQIITPITRIDIEKEIENLKPEIYSKERFKKREPSLEETEKELLREAKENYRSILFWKNSKNRKIYISENLEVRYKTRLENWRHEKSFFENEESEKERKKNDEFQKEFEFKKRLLEGNLEGTSEAVLMNFETILNEINIKPEFFLDFEYDEKQKHFHIDLDLPEIENIPNETGSILKSGKLSVKNKTQKSLKEDYAKCVTGLGLLIAGVAFMSGAGVEKVFISGYSQRIDKRDGKEKNDYLYTIDLDKEQFSKINFEQIDPLETFKLFSHNISLSKTFEFTPIEKTLINQQV
ncbi:DUF4236 domain-containing protein [Christiangramia portivictoriae]|uniref:DUF4236 domain-containing protein n=1 Tax=Christiangramia portivictoriae TaxID=326069 RepID=UPI000407BDE2|nr:DUF4236 domain-containing protein [Christiangramia portivictoriae]